MSNIHSLLIKHDIESISKNIYYLFDFSWSEHLCCPFFYSDSVRSIAQSLMDGRFTIKCLSERQIYCVSNDTVLPHQLQLSLFRKAKYSTVHTSVDIGAKTSLNFFDLLIIREGKILLANLSLGIFIKIYNENYLLHTIRDSQKIVNDFDLTNSLLGIKTYICNNLLFVLEPRAKGEDFSNYTIQVQEKLINKLALRHHNESIGNFSFPPSTYNSFKKFAISTYEKLDPIHCKLFKSSINRNFSNVVSAPKRFSHRDFTAHNLVVKDQIIPIDLSPLKLGYAPSWYDTLTLMITESSEYERHSLLIDFIEGYNSEYLNCFPIFKNKTARIDAVIFNILFMTWLPFKITLKRISSWTSGYINYLL